MITNTKEKIFEYIVNNAPVGVTQISNHFGISTQITHRHLKDLIIKNKITKSGNPPKVYYFPISNIEEKKYNIIQEKKDFLEKYFILFEPNGEVLNGIAGFIRWCDKRNLNFEQELEIYENTIKKYEIYKGKNGLINGMEKMKNTFEKVYLDEIYYIDFYSIEKYGKTLLGNLMLYGKQNADNDIIKKILEIIKPIIYDFIDKNNIDSFAFIPPSIKRKVQLLSKINSGINIKLSELKLIKIFKDKIVSQKSLSKKEDRIENARETIFIENKNFKTNKILLIDDAVGSGATLNETAKKIKEAGISNYVVGIAIVGSFKGFEVINEV